MERPRVNKLSQPERELIRRAMQVLAWGPFIRESEFQTVIGIERSELVRIVSAWPDAVVSTRHERSAFRTQEKAVSGVLHNLEEFPHREADRLRDELGLSHEELVALVERWEATRPG